MKISPARVAAFDILKRIETERSLSSALLATFEDELTPVDRGLCHQLVLGVLRRQIYLDRLVDVLTGSKKLDIEVRIAFRIGAYQLLYLDKIPAYSAINESVNLVQRAKKTSAKGIVNAVLRKISAGVPDLEFADDVDRISVETSHPRWLIKKWVTDFGTETAEQIAGSNNTAPRLTFRASRRDMSVESLGQQVNDVEGCYFADEMTDELRGAAERGEIYFQDAGSQLVGLSVGDINGKRFLDLCASPGGKTTQISANNSASMTVAGDLRESRVNLLRATCRKQGFPDVQVVQYDAEVSIPFADASFDVVLIDAPCSGTGTIRHNPEIRHFLDPDDFTELGKKQLAILENASKLVTSGGRLIYSTCSLQAEENEGVCQAFEAGNPDFRRTKPVVPEKFITADGFARTFPHRDGMDGFFIAHLERS